MKALLPWDVNASFTADRLQLLARTIAGSRAACLELYTPDLGDDPWTQGCRAYRWACHAIRKLHSSGQCPWLTVLEDQLAFTMMIDGHAIRMYRGDAANPSARSLKQGLGALNQASLFDLLPEAAPEESAWFWLMAVETDAEGSVVRIVIVQTNTGRESRVMWSIPLDEPVAVVAELLSAERDGVDLPPPFVGPKHDHSDESESGDENEAGS